MDVAEVERIELGSVHLVVYVAMLGATVVGQLAGIMIDSAFGSRSLWVPCGLSVVLEALVGARYGAARTRHPLTAGQSARVSATYSALLLTISAPLALWIVASRPVSTAHPAWTFVDVGVALAGLAGATVARAALMRAFSPRSP